MRYDSLLNPVSDAEPCGPDLDEIGDDAYLNYMLGAGNRIPERYVEFKTGVGVPFDRSTIDLKTEVKTISGFLEQSRDLRLLALEARFQALAGQIDGFVECVVTMAGLVDKFWADVHPKPFDDDYTLRQNTVGTLEDRTSIIFPLEYAPLLRDQRIGTVSLRDYGIAMGTVVPRENENKLEAAMLTDVLASDAHKATLTALHGTVIACRNALTTIRTAFDEGTDYQYSPDFELLLDVLGQLQKFAETARPELVAVPDADPAGAESPADEEQDAGTGDGSAQQRAAPRAARAEIAGTVIDSQKSAAAALLAAEHYFGREEPSSPALILVHQARSLVGKSLVEALESLMPLQAEQASIIVDANFGFEFSMAKMKAITEDYSASIADLNDTAKEAQVFTISTREDAIAAIYGVSAFFRANEPSSPIPMLLGKADKFLNQNFLTIVADLLTKKTSV